MGQSSNAVEELILRIKEAMQAEKVRLGQEIPKNIIRGTEHSLIQSKLQDLELEIRTNNLNWQITAEQTIKSHRKILGRFIIFGKKFVRKFLRWYIDPPFEQQREFNRSVTRSINILQEVINLGISDHMNQSKLLGELQTRIARLDDLKQDIKEFTEIFETKNPDIDYFLFEQKFRGSRDEIKQKQKQYLHYFMGKKKILDVGCGRGEFVELMLENGAEITGIDINEDMAQYCQDKGLPVLKMDVFAYLETLEDNSLDGIFMAQVIEHLSPAALVKLIAAAYSKLGKSGTLLMETINPENLTAINNCFYMDLTHVRPVHPLTAQFLMESQGFMNIEFVYSGPVEGSKIPHLDIEGHNNAEFNLALDKLNHLLYGPQDYAIIGIK